MFVPLSHLLFILDLLDQSYVSEASTACRRVISLWQLAALYQHRADGVNPVGNFSFARTLSNDNPPIH